MPPIPHPPSQARSTAPAAYKAVNDAYYAELVKAPASARSRAQASYAIAAAIATALVTAGVLTDFEQRYAGVKIAGLIAVGAWMATALIFMLAVGVGVDPVHTGDFDTDQFVDAVAANVKHEVDQVNNSIKSGLEASQCPAANKVGSHQLTFTLPTRQILAYSRESK